jgi:uncharacterized protein YkwD
MLEVINQARHEAGVEPLKYSMKIEPAAQRHSNDMARTDKMGHIGETQHTPSDPVYG